MMLNKVVLPQPGGPIRHISSVFESLNESLLSTVSFRLPAPVEVTHRSVIFSVEIVDQGALK